MNQPRFFFAITAIAMTSTITADAMMILVVMLHLPSAGDPDSCRQKGL